MQIQTRPFLSQTPKNAPPPPPPADPTPAPDFVETSCSARRDGLLGAALASPMLLPKNGATAVGGVVGGLGLLTAYGEIREGMRIMNTHEVIDGALHMGASGALLAGAVLPSPVVGALITAGGLTLLSVKVVYDHPKDVADILVRQPLTLVRDAGKSVWNEISPPASQPKPDTKNKN